MTEINYLQCSPYCEYPAPDFERQLPEKYTCEGDMMSAVEERWNAVMYKTENSIIYSENITHTLEKEFKQEVDNVQVRRFSMTFVLI